MFAVGSAVIVTLVVVETGEHPADGVVYVTVYVPAALKDGMMAPVVLFIESPPGADVKMPPAYEPVPESVTACAVESDLQNGAPVYDIEAVGTWFIVTEAVVVTGSQPPDAGVI